MTLFLAELNFDGRWRRSAIPVRRGGVQGVSPWAPSRNALACRQLPAQVPGRRCGRPQGLHHDEVWEVDTSQALRDPEGFEHWVPCCGFLHTREASVGAPGWRVGCLGMMFVLLGKSTRVVTEFWLPDEESQNNRFHLVR